MSVTMDEGKEFLRHIKDITRCAICTNACTEPKVLPCIHTFCLRCLEEWGKGKQPGDQVPCPMCHKEFKVPAGSFKALPDNFFVEKLLDMKVISIAKGQELKCDVCAEAGSQDPKNFATSYCVNCCQTLCAPCASSHGGITSSKTHKVVPIGTNLEHPDLFKLAITQCDKHPDKPIELYCFDCRSCICAMCFYETHKKHECSTIQKVVEQFHIRLQSDISQLADNIAKIRANSGQLGKEKTDFTEHITTLEAAIIKRSDDLKALIDRHTQSLLQELTAIREEKLKEAEIAQQEVEQKLILLESFKKYCEEVRDKGTPVEICRVADDLHVRASELQDLPINQEGICNIETFIVTFTPTDLQDLLMGERNNLVGKLSNKTKHPPGYQIIENGNKGVRSEHTDFQQQLQSKMNGEKPVIYQNKRTSKGHVCFTVCTPDGKCVTIENNGKKDENLQGWRIRRNVDGVDVAEYIFDSKFASIKRGEKITIWAKGSRMSGCFNSTNIEGSEDSWGVGDVVITKLISPDGDERATHIQKTVYQ